MSSKFIIKIDAFCVCVHLVRVRSKAERERFVANIRIEMDFLTHCIAYWVELFKFYYHRIRVKLVPNFSYGLSNRIEI